MSVYTRFKIDATGLDSDVVSSPNDIVTGGVWSENIASLTTHYSSSVLTNTQRQYYLDVLQDDPANDGAAVQYSVAYGHRLGSGSNSVGQLNDSPSRAIYSQHARLLLAPGDSRFTYSSGSTDSIYVINFKRNRLKERMDPGNFELPLCNITARSNANATSSITVGSTVYTLIDDSALTTASIGESGRVYGICSGSINNGIFYSSGRPVYYGLVYPDQGIMVLDGNRLDQNLGFKTNVSSSSEANNHFTLFRSISGSALQINVDTSDAYGFLARNSETITSTHYFVRIKNGQYNYSNNPTYVTGSAGLIAQPSFRTEPKTYVTTVGLYDDSNNLLAVAKLSKPLLKSFQREALIRVKLDY